MAPNQLTTPADQYVDAHFASDQARRCRRLAQAINDRETAQILESMADEFDRRSRAID